MHQKAGSKAAPKGIEGSNFSWLRLDHRGRTAAISSDAMNGTPIPLTASAGLDFKDRRTGLIIFGILEILLGGLAALMILLMIFAQVMAAKATQEPTPLRQMIPGLVFYAIVAVVLIALGIGSCQTRRWARALSLLVAWSWLAMGVISMVAMAFFLPSILNAPQAQGQKLPESARLVVMLVSMIFMGILFLAVPGVLVLFYQSRHVKATCETRDPSPRWTDACPLPVLGLSLWLGFGAVSMLTLPISIRGVIPVFGRLLSGVGGSLCCVGLAVLWAYSAWAVYQLRVVGWWIVLSSLCVMAASAWITFTQIDLLETYRVMGYPEKQIEVMKQFSFIHRHGMAYFSVAGAIPMLGLLLFVKRYFRHPA
jgi:hypothetical protein